MTNSKKEKRGLGRGLSALMADVDLAVPGHHSTISQPAKGPDTVLPIEKIYPNPDQPRRDFDKADLDELTASIREKGIIQPLLVRKKPSKLGEYQIVAGERRWRAAQMANLHEVPVLIREISDTEVLELAIIENIQRADLNALEEALGFRQLMERFGHTQEKLGEVLGKSRSYIANLLRLLNLPLDVQGYLREGKLTNGHARALVPSDNPSELARIVIAKGLSVRQTEELVKRPKTKPIKTNKIKEEKDADTKELELQLMAQIGMKLEILHSPKEEAGSITIKYASLNELDDLCNILTAGSQDATK